MYLTAKGCMQRLTKPQRADLAVTPVPGSAPSPVSRRFCYLTVDTPRGKIHTVYILLRVLQEGVGMYKGTI